jgi:hypothetical protein
MSESRTNTKWLVGGVAVLVVAAAVAFWAMRSPKLPSPSDDPAVLAHFVRSSQFNKLPEADKRPYMKALRKSMAQVTEARNQGRISQNDYEAAYLNAYLERKLDHMDEFFSLPQAKRKQALVAEYVKKDRVKPATMAALASAPPEPESQKEDDFVKHRVAKWPTEERAKWEEYHKASKEAKQMAKSVK